MIRLESLYASSHVDKILKYLCTKMPVECLAHLFCMCMAIATGKVGPVFTGPIFQVGVN